MRFGFGGAGVGRAGGGSEGFGRRRPGRRQMGLRIGALCVGLAALGCAPRVAPWIELDPGAGKLVTILRVDEPVGEGDDLRLVTRTEIHLHTANGVRILPIEAPRDVRFLDPETLLVIEELPVEEEGGLPETRMILFHTKSEEVQPIGEGSGYYDPEPSPDGSLLAVGRDQPTHGDADLAVFDLTSHERLANRRQGFEEPRWRPDGSRLVVAMMIADPEELSDRGGEMAGTSFVWPRLHVLRSNLAVGPLVPDAETPDTLEPGGTLPLWWDADGIWARQNRGLVRCQPEGGCALAYSPGEEDRIVDGRPVGGGQALLLVVSKHGAFDKRLPDAVHRVDLATGEGHVVHRTLRSEYLLDLDWIALP